MNEIRISFDQQRAVRVDDGAELIAMPLSPHAPSRCRGCEAFETDKVCAKSCYNLGARRRLCRSYERKDGLDITWRLKNG